MIMLALLSSVYAYEPVKGITFGNVSEIKNHEFYHDIRLRFQIHRQAETAYPDQLIYSALYFGSLISWKKIEPMGAIDRLCKRNNTLDIYEVSLEQLNDRRRFPMDRVPGAGALLGVVWGYFEPQGFSSENDVIVVTSRDALSNSRVLYHEIAHYWYSAFCLERYTTLTSEEFAMAVQNEGEP